ncbi:MAG: hypothetical protein P1P88_10030 [Bacteroidales bacterium]|nr:hypothetical protein [Bacteroidales bacterium]
MKNLKNITTIALILTVLVFLLTIADFLALHDIRNDYVSKKIITSISQTLPAYTNTSGEWQVVNISFISRFLFFIFNVGVLLLILRKSGKQKQRQTT